MKNNKPQNLFFLNLKKNIKYLIIFTIFNYLGANAQFYNQHYIAPAPWQYFSNANEIVIATNSTTSVNVTISRSNGTLVTTLSTIKGTPAVYRFTGDPTSLPYHLTNTVINGAGLIVNAAVPVSVNIRNVASDQLAVGADANNIKGNASLTSFGDAGKGTNFRVGYYRDGDLGNFGNNGFRRPIYSILAIQNNTSVQINNVATVTLNAGQSYLFEAAMGSLVTTTLPVVMNTSAKIDTPNGCGDGTLDQIAPNAVLGSEYFLVRGNGNSTAEQTTVIATLPNTVLTITNFNAAGVQVSTSTQTLVNAGSFYTLQNGNGTALSASRIVATKNVIAYSGSAENCEVDIATLAPVSACGGSNFVETYKFRNYTAANLPYTGYILVQDASILVDFNGSNLETVAGARRQLGTTGWYLIDFTNIELGNPNFISLSSATKMNVVIIQQGGGFSMSAVFSSFTEIPAAANVTYLSGSQCTSQSATLTTSPGFAPYQWFLDGNPITGANTNSYTATVSGSYTVSSTLTCSVPFQSAPVQVTLCGDVAVNKSVNNLSPTVGSNVIFTVTATNNGPSNANGVSVSDLLPNGYNYVSSVVPSGTTYNSSTGLWSIGNLTNGQSVSLTITATVLTSGSYLNTAQITSSNQPDTNLSNNSSSVTPVPCPAIPTLSTVTQPTCSVATGSFTITNYNAAFSYTVSPSTGVTISGNTITAPAGIYTVTATFGSCTSAASVSRTVNAQPATPSAPTAGTITQPTCSTATGSVVLSGLPSSGTWTLTRNPGAVTTTGTGTSTTISGLATGTYTYTVTNSVGCTSVASANVVITAQPATPSVPTEFVTVYV